MGHIKTIGGSGSGGGGVGAAEWGPDFGNPASNVRVATQLSALEVAAMPVGTARVATKVSALSIAGLPIGTARVACDGADFSADINRGSNSAVNDGPQNWTNPTNAQGNWDAVEATRAGQAAATTDANLRLNYANFSGGITGFTILSVVLLFAARQTGTVSNNGGLHFEYRLGGAGAWTTLATHTGDVDFSGSDAQEFDISAAIGGSWTNVNSLETRVRAVLAIGTNLVTCFCDAVEMVIAAIGSST